MIPRGSPCDLFVSKSSFKGDFGISLKLRLLMHIDATHNFSVLNTKFDKIYIISEIYQSYNMKITKDNE